MFKKKNARNDSNITFIEKMASIMINFISSDDKVNGLIQMLYDKSIGRDINISNLKIKTKTKSNTITDVDMFIYGYLVLLYEYISIEQESEYKEIIKELYYRLHDVIYNDRIRKINNNIINVYIV